MLSISSNAAAHAFLRVLGRSTLEEEWGRIGLSQTHVPDDGDAVTSAADVARLMRMLATSPESSPPHPVTCCCSALLVSPRRTVILVVVDRGVDPADARGVIAQAGQAVYRSLLQ